MTAENTTNKTISFDEAKQLELQILKYIDKTLKENGIPYWLDAGTLLGSVRHKGFIPWDDDIDLVIMRNDYDRAIEVLNNSSDRYKVLTMHNTEDYYYTFAKITDTHTHIVERDWREIKSLGIYVDLFPLDYLPADDREFYRLANTVFALRAMVTFSMMDRGQFRRARLKQKLEFLAGRLYGQKRALKKIDKICAEYSASHPDTGVIADIVAANDRKVRIPAETFAETLQGEFEGDLYPIPAGYDRFLRSYYGEYMELPPVEKRVSTHGFKAYWIR